MFKNLLIGGKTKNMERPIKGGYILISLGLIALSTSYSGSIEYDKISRTKKHIVLTGIKVGDTVMPDICVKPVYGNGTITFEDVYGFDVVVSSNNSVSVSEHISKSKYYLHTLNGGGYEGIKIVMSDKDPINFANITNQDYLREYLENRNVIIFVNKYGEHLIFDSTNTYYTAIRVDNGAIDFADLDDWDTTEVIDTVTEF